MLESRQKEVQNVILEKTYKNKSCWNKGRDAALAPAEGSKSHVCSDALLHKRLGSN